MFLAKFNSIRTSLIWFLSAQTISICSSQATVLVSTLCKLPFCVWVWPGIWVWPYSSILLAFLPDIFVGMYQTWTWRGRFLNVNHLSWASLFSTDLSQPVLLSRPMRKSKPAFLKFRVVSLLCFLLAVAKILNLTFMVTAAKVVFKLQIPHQALRVD